MAAKYTQTFVSCNKQSKRKCRAGVWCRHKINSSAFSLVCSKRDGTPALQPVRVQLCSVGANLISALGNDCLRQIVGAHCCWSIFNRVSLWTRKREWSGDERARARVPCQMKCHGDGWVCVFWWWSLPSFLFHDEQICSKERDLIHSWAHSLSLSLSRHYLLTRLKGNPHVAIAICTWYACKWAECVWLMD